MGFIEDYYIKPLLANGFFNPVNTITYGLLLIAGFVLVYKLLKRLHVTIDNRLMLAILPFVFFASATRALRDFIYNNIRPENYPAFFEDLNVNYSTVAGEAYNYIINIVPVHSLAGLEAWILALFPTPGSYLLTFIIALVTLLISLVIQKYSKIKYWKIMFILGIIYSLWTIILLPISFLQPLTIIVPIFIGWIVVLYGFSYLLRTQWFTKKFPNNFFTKALTYENTGILNAHMLDATATFTALTYFGFIEQHVVPRLFIPLGGPAVMFVLKLVVIVPVLYVIDQHKGDPNFKNLLKIAVLILGLAPALRDIITLLLVST